MHDVIEDTVVGTVVDVSLKIAYLVDAMLDTACVVRIVVDTMPFDLNDTAWTWTDEHAVTVSLPAWLAGPLAQEWVADRSLLRHLGGPSDPHAQISDRTLISLAAL